MTVVISGVSLWISIGWNMVDGILKVIENHLIDLCRIGLGYILLGSYRQQRDITEHTHQIEIHDGAQRMTFTHISLVQRLALPFYLGFVFDEFITAVDALIIAGPVGLVEIQV